MTKLSFSEKLDRFENGSLELAEEFCADDEFINSKPEEYGVHVERRIATANAAQAAKIIEEEQRYYDPAQWERPLYEGHALAHVGGSVRVIKVREVRE